MEEIINKYYDHFIITYPNKTKRYYINNIEVNQRSYNEYEKELNELYN